MLQVHQQEQQQHPATALQSVEVQYSSKVGPSTCSWFCCSWQ
jgi:hypothetical protein